MHHSPGLASSLAMQAYLRHRGTPVCLHELLVQAMRQQCQRAGAARPTIVTQADEAEPAAPQGQEPAPPRPS